MKTRTYNTTLCYCRNIQKVIINCSPFRYQREEYNGGVVEDQATQAVVTATSRSTQWIKSDAAVPLEEPAFVYDSDDNKTDSEDGEKIDDSYADSEVDISEEEDSDSSQGTC